MYDRMSLHEKLVEALGSDHVYFQPPASVRMEYPAIRYERDRIDNRHSNNEPYMQNTAYKVTLICFDPDDKLVERVSKLEKCRHTRFYVMDGLNHDVFTIYN